MTKEEKEKALSFLKSAKKARWAYAILMGISLTLGAITGKLEYFIAAGFISFLDIVIVKTRMEKIIIKLTE